VDKGGHTVGIGEELVVQSLGGLEIEKAAIVQFG